MFKNLMKFWQGKDFISRVFEDFSDMLVSSQEMFDLVCKHLIHGENIPSLKDKIYVLDKKVNELEKNIRKRIVEHLTFQPQVDVTVCLLLMSVVKDAERLGDYCKNLFEVIEITGGQVDKNKYENIFNGINDELGDLFDKTKKAILQSSEDDAKATWDAEKKIAKRCDEIIVELSKSGLTAKEAVSFTLIARHFKRLSAHLTNIATSVILPISELDYFDETHEEE